VKPTGKPQRVCIGCGQLCEPGGPRQLRCKSCAAEHSRKKNLEYQHAFRARNRSPEDAARIERRGWWLDAMKYRAESLVADGMNPTACAERLGISHHTILKHLDSPEARRRVGILMRTDMPELPH
jgi:DNA-binding CsgD family transcriptional regulator